jgi:A/G-specific adenine glycosylase
LNRPEHNKKIIRLVRELLSWFSQSARDLPWRCTRDPYAIHVSEIMLQQTQVKTVIPYWERWMRELPTIQSLADARPEKIHKLWEGLGYYTRVRNLQKAAQQIVAQHGGKFPRDFDDILALPGVGRYTAGAIASIAFNEPHPILDGNVIRVLTRVFGVAENPREKSTNQKLWQLATQLVTAAPHGEKDPKSNSSPSPLNGERARVRGGKVQLQYQLVESVPHPASCSHLNQSLMELGALICTPKQPKCLLCPVRPDCIAYRTGRVEQFPNLGPRAAATSRRFVAFVIQNRGRYLVRQRPAGIVNAHLWEFPNLETSAADVELPKLAAAELGLKISSLKKLCSLKHTITRYRITLDAFVAASRKSAAKSSVSLRNDAEKKWLTPRQLDSLAFTSAHRKILNQLALTTDKE